MKKLIVLAPIGMATLLAATAAQANNEVLIYSHGGEVSVTHDGLLDNGNGAQTAEVLMGAGFTNQMNDIFTLHGSAKVGTKLTTLDDTDGDFYVDEAIIGLEHASAGYLSYGDQDSVYETIQDITDLSVDYYARTPGLAQRDAAYGDGNVLRYDNTVGGVKISASASLDENGHSFGAVVPTDFATVVLANVHADGGDAFYVGAVRELPQYKVTLTGGVELMDQQAGDMDSYHLGAKYKVTENLNVRGTVVEVLGESDYATIGAEYFFTPDLVGGAEAKVQGGDADAYVQLNYKF